ncbi:MAG TPA: class I SAM-dependent methyltransferase [Acidimicrobiales bacterium]
MSVSEIHHPLFARLYDRMSVGLEAKGAAEHREELLGDLSGRVIEVGAGTGLNFAHYPASVSEVVAVEPEAYLRERAERAARDAKVPVRVVPGTAEELPVEDGSFDAAVASLVLCSVRDQHPALAELYRVLTPGGQLRFYEHVRSQRRGFARFQRVVDVGWPCFGGGCHTSRATDRNIEEAGFVIERCRRFEFRPCLLTWPVAPHVIGLARRPGP